MFKQSPSRNQRSKRFKVKHILQICVLLAVFFWLIYQVKRSHDKKKAFDESEAKISLRDHVHDEVVKFGRKDLHPRLEERTMTNGKPDEEEAEEDETGAGEDDNKHEEEEQEEDNKTEEKDDDGRGGGDDEIDEQDQDKSELEIEREEEFGDDEKEREIDEKEAEEKDVEDKGGQNEQEISLEDHDHEGVSRNAHEAREELYKADDASSAVTHETEAVSTETNIETSENSDGNNETDILEEESKPNRTEEISANQDNRILVTGGGEVLENGILPNVTGKEEDVQEIVSSKAEENPGLNSTTTTEMKNEPQVVGNNTAVGISEINNLSLQNETETKPESTEVHNTTMAVKNSEDLSLQTASVGQVNNTSRSASDEETPDSNLATSHDTEHAERAVAEYSNSSNATDVATPGKDIKSNESIEVKRVSNTTQNDDADGNEGKDGNGTDESIDNSKTEDIEAHHDPIDSEDSGITLEKDVRTDLETLPEIRTEASNHGDAATE